MVQAVVESLHENHTDLGGPICPLREPAAHVVGVDDLARASEEHRAATRDRARRAGEVDEPADELGAVIGAAATRSSMSVTPST